MNFLQHRGDQVVAGTNAQMRRLLLQQTESRIARIRRWFSHLFPRHNTPAAIHMEPRLVDRRPSGSSARAADIRALTAEASFLLAVQPSLAPPSDFRSGLFHPECGWPVSQTVDRWFDGGEGQA
jgi:hypothetical protein